MSARFRPWMVFALLLAVASPYAAADLSSCAWTPGFSYEDLNSVVRALAVFDDGNGPALYAGGDFTAAGQKVASRVARWDGAAWSPLGPPGAEGVNDRVEALTVFDDGSGPALYVGGSFTTAGGLAANYVARWDGSSWSALGAGASNGTSGTVHALASHNDGSGEALYVGGLFADAGGLLANNLARWDGAAFSVVDSVFGPGLEDRVRALAVFGGELVAAGNFISAEGTTVNGIASWDGAAWSALSGPAGVGLFGGFPRRLHVADLGGGPELFVAGDLFQAGGLPTGDVVRWNGTSWAAMGNLFFGSEAVEVSALASFNDGSATALYAGGSYVTPDFSVVGFVARWTGGGWGIEAQGMGFDEFFGDGVRVLLAHDDGFGNRLYAGGGATLLEGQPVSHLARTDGSSWSRVSNAASGGLDGAASAFAFFQGSVYAGGSFRKAGQEIVHHIARWNGTTWEALPGPGGVFGTDGTVLALVVYDDGGGHQLYVGGEFDSVGGVTASGIARWDGSAWSTVPGSATAVRNITALKVFDDGSGERLYGAGFFSIGGFDRVARWDGATWNRLVGASGTGVDGAVNTLAVFDDGAGQALYLGGDFTQAGGVPADRIARWDGTNWLPMTGVGGHPNASVEALAVVNEPTGRALYVGGFFPTAGGQTANHIARFRGGAWSALSSASGLGLPNGVSALARFIVGSEVYMVAGGSFLTAGGETVHRVAAWNGTSWQPLAGSNGSGVSEFHIGYGSGRVSTLVALDDGAGPALWLGGDFFLTGRVPAGQVGRFGCGPLFADGFETGDTSRWTSTVQSGTVP